MGHKDLMKLHAIYDEIRRLNEKHNWDYNFKVDDGDYETRIDIDSDGDCIAGNGKVPLPGYEMKCPDLLDFKKKIIIEFEEEAKSSIGYLGAKLRKGHSEMLNAKDEVRDWYYHQAKFLFLKIWESQFKDGSWKAVIYIFLKRCRAGKFEEIET